MYGTKLLHDIAGPTAKVTGVVLSDWWELRLKNWLGIAEAAEAIVGDDPPPGAVHPQVLHRILDDATWLDDELMQRYAGGLLAASRTADGREQRGAYYLNLVSFMTPTQIRLHYQIYSAIAMHAPSALDMGKTSGTLEACVLFDLDTLAEHFDIVETPELDIGEAAGGLAREGLVEGLIVGPSRYFRDFNRMTAAIGESAAVFQPTPLGALLFLWCHGHRTANHNSLLSLRESRNFADVAEAIGIGDWFGVASLDDLFGGDNSTTHPT